MIVLSHRGYWQDAKEKNREIAFCRSFDLGFGTETDIRDRNGSLVISHDMPTGDEISFSDLLRILRNRDLPLALNIKADGLVGALRETLISRSLGKWFVFDMAVPDMRAYLEAGIPVFTRMSEVERQSAWLEQSDGVWLDAFSDIWYDARTIETLLRAGKKVCVVSSELHGRDAEAQWHMLRELPTHPDLMLCTDHPEKAKKFFGDRLND
ncbi:hypothetical protein LMG28614_02835 [Paraburkholderia ultramafica]|uniref:Phosphodiesterase n=1 Tax=Paraburkholderia ultramafica TaxID=1544867 RepID=A0A6S7BJZ2_9BURK|nr:phosphodiesterase [Paraburkholderia ultramafica]CAB3789254.1 hypothetical protein LMG28614_02835 [Paraburkholderia ultramafica]